MAGIKRLVLDVLVPNNLPLTVLTHKISEVRGVEGVDVLIQEVERKVESSKITIEGDNLDFEEVRKVIEKTGATLHSVDRVSAGKRLVG